MGRGKEKVLIADKDFSALSKVFEERRYQVIEVCDEEEAVEKAYTEIPDLIIGNFDLPEMDCVSFLRSVRNNALLQNTPIVVVGRDASPEECLSIVGEGVDDYITTPYNFEELFMRVERIMTRTEAALNANPLTRLPGNVSIKDEMQRRIDAQESFSTCFIDLDNFKAFNDRYGFERGDDAIYLTGEIMVDVVRKHGGTANNFVGHIGGDDFVFICDDSLANILCTELVKKFDSSIRSLYDYDDLTRGTIVAEDRVGRIKNFPIMSISIAVVNYTSGRGIHHAEISQRGCELKKYVKSFNGSNFVEDRRKL